MKLTTGISPKYVQNWNVEKAVREIIQNYLDSREEFNCEGQVIWSDGIAHVKDFGPGIEPRHLALGISEKSDTAKGKYGEGLKLALMVLAREGRYAEIWSGGRKIAPAIEHDGGFGTDVLVLHVEDLPPRMQATHQGTSIKFECTQEELSVGKGYFIEFRRKAREFRWLERGKISQPGGDIYINGTKVGELSNAMFSYHLEISKNHNIGNRDREVINMNIVMPRIQQLIGLTSSTEVMKTCLKMITNPARCWETTHGPGYAELSAGSAKVWRKVFWQVYGKDAVISSYSARADNSARHLGYQTLEGISYEWTSFLRHQCGIKSAQDVVSGAGKGSCKRVALKDLEDQERANLELAKALTSKHYAEPEEIRIVDNLSKMVGEGSRVVVNGLWDRSKQMIFLDRRILTNRGKTLHTLLHEVVHQKTGYEDLTEEFEMALLNVAIGMMNLDEVQ